MLLNCNVQDLIFFGETFAFGFDPAGLVLVGKIARDLLASWFCGWWFRVAGSSEAEQQMACESSKPKQKLLLNHLLDPQVCLFNDVTNLTNDKERKCIRHDKPCDS